MQPLSAALARARRGFVATGMFSALLNLLMLATPIYMLQVFDRVLTTAHSDTLIGLTIIVMAALAVLGILEGVRLMVLSRTAAWIGAETGPEVLGMSLAAARSARGPAGQPLRDLAQVQGFLGSTGLNPFFDAPWTPIFILIIFLLHPALGLLALGTAVLLLAIAVLNDRTTRAALSDAAADQMRAMARADEAIRNSEVVHAMAMSRAATVRWQVAADAAARGQDSASQRMSIFLAFSRFLRFGAQVGVLGLGAALVLGGQLSPGGMIAGSILLGRALAPVDQAIGAWRGFVAARQAYERLARLLHTVPALDDAMPLPVPRGEVSVEQATFLHPGADRPAVDRVSFAAAPGETVAIIGRSAAGKSTLCRLLVGAWRPTAGHVRLDGAEVADWPRSQFGRHVGYLPQDVQLFSGSVRENIARLEDGDAERVVAAAKAAGVHEMVLQLPNGYDTDIGVQGARLSGGQRQRIGLARALYGDPELLVLDEPNANLDATGEAALVESLRAAKADGTTIFLSTHKLGLLALADKVILLDEGQLRAFGPAETVLDALRRQGAIEAPRKRVAKRADMGAATEADVV